MSSSPRNQHHNKNPVKHPIISLQSTRSLNQSNSDSHLPSQLGIKCMFNTSIKRSDDCVDEQCVAVTTTVKQHSLVDMRRDAAGGRSAVQQSLCVKVGGRMKPERVRDGLHGAAKKIQVKQDCCRKYSAIHQGRGA